MNRNQRNANRENARTLASRAKQLLLQNHTCENCGEKGGHWISIRGISVEGLMTGKDDSSGFWTCPKLYGPDGKRLDVSDAPSALRLPNLDATAAALLLRGYAASLSHQGSGS